MPLEAKDIFEAHSCNVRELLSGKGLGLYVPAYQRPYGWDKEKVSKLIDDALHGYVFLLKSQESFTFLGTIITIHDINFTTIQPIVRQEVPSKVLTIIDGQQRLTTLLLLCLALHNQIQVALSKVIKRKKREELSGAEGWLHDQARRAIDDLYATFVDKQAYGDKPLYPRMIRAFDDQWSRSAQNAKYNSPIAHLIANYADWAEAEKPREFKPVKREGSLEGEQAVVERFAQIARILRAIANGNNKDELEEFPTLEQLCKSKDAQLSLLNHEIPMEVHIAIANEGATEEFECLFNLVLFAFYILNQVAVTVVRGKNEDYAFTVFESLNTTGEPLTAYETFKPRVVNAEGLAKYETSEARKLLDDVSNYLAQFKVGDQLQAITQDLLINFASAEDGAKLSKRLADQRRYLKEQFEDYESDKGKRRAFVRNLRDVAIFSQHSWVASPRMPSLYQLPVDATTDAVKLCLAFLVDLKHTIAIGPLVRFYSRAIQAGDAQRVEEIKNFEGALKAMTAFSVLWRAATRNTRNIDQEYREILTGTKNLTALKHIARVSNGVADEPFSVEELKAELRARLSDTNHGDVGSKDRFVELASTLPIYEVNRHVARMILLAAYHDAIEDAKEPGLVMKGKLAVSPCLTYEAFRDLKYLSLEHIAPQTQNDGWQIDLWKNKEDIHRLGNLVLVQSDANSSLSNRPWAQKKILFAALSASSTQEAERILAESGFNFGEKTEEIAKLSAFMPHLSAVSKKQDDWDTAFIDKRSQTLFALAWDELYQWLGPTDKKIDK